MSTVINTNIAAIRTHNVYNRNDTQMNAALTRVATGMKINSAKDGASTWAISEKMRERIRANDSNITSDRSTIATEIKSLVAEIDDNANKVKFNGRYLLNGAVDSSSAFGGAGSDIGVTASDPGGVGAVYSLTNFKTLASGCVTQAASADTEKLIALTDSSGNALLQKGDTITMSWKENGQEVSKSYTLSAGTETLTNRATAVDGTGSLKMKWVAADTAIDSGNVLNQNFSDAKSTSAGLYAYSTDAKTLITDVAISVIRTANGSMSNVTAAQDALKVSGVQQVFGPLKGSNVVYELGGSAGLDSATAAGTVGGTLKAAGFTSADTNNVTFNIDGKEVTVKGNTFIGDINKAFADAGINAGIQSTSKETLLNMTALK